MEEFELKSIWDAYDKKLDRSLHLNMKVLETMQADKTRSKLNALLFVKWTGIFLGILWILLLAILLYGNHLRNTYFSVSVAIIFLFSVLGIAVYVKHIILINRLDYTEGIIQAQRKLAELQVSTIQITRILWLQMPFYTTFFWSKGWIYSSPQTFWLIAVPITIAFTLLTAWLYKNITPQNLDKKWVSKLMALGIEYKYVVAADKLLKEIEDLRINSFDNR